MNRKISLIIASLAMFGIAFSAFSESKRIEVYPLSQNYWETKPGETLGEIATQLLPHNHGMQKKLMSDIISQNPNAFQNNDPNFMRANTKLWLPNRLAQKGSKADPKRTQVESFSWGNIKRPKRLSSQQ